MYSRNETAGKHEIGNSVLVLRAGLGDTYSIAMITVLRFVVGLAWGSFLNVLIDRLPKGESVVWGRSRCDYCKKPLRWFELIPILSYIIQKGRCRRCHKRLSFQYPLIECMTGIGFVSLSSISHSWSLLLSHSILFSAFLVIFVADFKYQIIPDSMILVGIFAAIIPFLTTYTYQLAATNHLLAAFGVTVMFFLLWGVTRGRGMGLGDVKLVFLLGLLLGYPGIIVALYIAFLTGAIVGVILVVVRKKSLKSNIAFGPFLIIGTLIALVGQGYILYWWRALV